MMFLPPNDHLGGVAFHCAPLLCDLVFECVHHSLLCSVETGPVNSKIEFGGKTNAIKLTFLCSYEKIIN